MELPELAELLDRVVGHSARGRSRALLSLELGQARIGLCIVFASLALRRALAESLAEGGLASSGWDERGNHPIRTM